MESHQELLDILLQHESDLQFTEFTNDTALALGMALIDAVRREGKAVTIDIRRNDQQLFQHAMPGTSIDNAEWIRRKNNVVKRYGHSSFYMGTLYRSRATTFEEATKLDPHEFAAHGGAFPLIVKNVGVIGTISVSGLPQADDHALVVGVLTAFLGK